MAELPILDISPEYVPAWCVAQIICHGCNQVMVPPPTPFTDKTKAGDVAKLIHDQTGVICPDRRFVITIEEMLIDKRLANAPEGTRKLH